MSRCCANCKWVKPLLKGSENDYWVCTFAPIPRPHFDLINLQMIRHPGFRLSVGDPHSNYAELCATYEAKP